MTLSYRAHESCVHVAKGKRSIWEDTYDLTPTVRHSGKIAVQTVKRLVVARGEGGGRHELGQ